MPLQREHRRQYEGVETTRPGRRGSGPGYGTESGGERAIFGPGTPHRSDQCGARGPSRRSGRFTDRFVNKNPDVPIRNPLQIKGLSLLPIRGPHGAINWLNKRKKRTRSRQIRDRAVNLGPLFLNVRQKIQETPRTCVTTIMKSIRMFVLLACLVPSLVRAELELVDNAPGGIVHLRSTDNGRITDHFINASQIVRVELRTGQRRPDRVPRAKNNKASKKPKSKNFVWVYTTETKLVSEDYEQGKAGSRSVFHPIPCATDVEAKAVAERILTIIQEAEQGGAGQPATAPKSKSEGKEKPETESEGRPQ